MRDVGAAAHEALRAQSDAGRRREVALLAMESPERRRELESALVEAGFEVRHAASRAAPLDVPPATGPDGLVMLGGVSRTSADASGDDTSEAVAALREAGWDHVVVVGGDTRATAVARTLATGARGFLVAAPCRGAEAPGPVAVQAEPGLRSMPVSDVTGRERRLSAREVQVLALAAEGLSNPEIAERLGLSALTVKSHLSRMTRRLGARDRAHLVLLALRAGVIV
jgi:DNA-binding NarL/FixJ family response regulator